MMNDPVHFDASLHRPHWRELPRLQVLHGLNLPVIRAAVLAALNAWSVFLVTQVRGPVRVTLLDGVGESLQDKPPSPAIGVDEVKFCMADLEHLSLELEYDWVGRVLTSLCGGGAKPMALGPTLRPHSRLELEIRQRLIQQLMLSAVETWKTFLPEELQVMSPFTLACLQTATGHDAQQVLGVPFRVSWKSSSVHGRWHLPLSFLKRVSAWCEPVQTPHEGHDTPLSHWNDLPLEIGVVMGELDLDIETLRGATLGQFIPFEPSTQVQFRVDETPLLKGVLYTRHERHVVRVE